VYTSSPQKPCPASKVKFEFSDSCLPEDQKENDEDLNFEKGSGVYFYWNCGGGFAKKATKIEGILEKYVPHIFFIAECKYSKTTKKDITRVVEVIENKLNYKAYWSSKKEKKRKALILAFVKKGESIFHLRSEFVENEINEMIVLAHYFNDQLVIVQGCYVPFTVDKMKDMEDQMERFYYLTHIMSKNVNQVFPSTAFHVIIGDFNADFDQRKKKDYKYKVLLLEKLLTECSLERKELGVTKSVVVQSITRKSSIDHIMTNIEDNDVECGLLKTLKNKKLPSDHYLIFVENKVKEISKKIKPSEQQEEEKKKIEPINWEQSDNRQKFYCNMCSHFGEKGGKGCSSQTIFSYHMMTNHDVLDFHLYSGNDKTINMTIVAKNKNEEFLVGFTKDFGHYRLFLLKTVMEKEFLPLDFDNFEIFNTYKFHVHSWPKVPNDDLVVIQCANKRTIQISKTEIFKNLEKISLGTLMDIFPGKWLENKLLEADLIRCHSVGVLRNDDDEIKVLGRSKDNEIVLLNRIKKEPKMIKRRFQQNDGIDWLNASLQVILRALDFDKENVFSSHLGLILLGMSKSECPKDGFNSTLVHSICKPALIYNLVVI